uniref:Uncharacterized protein n=1 Tax=Parascaris univalens TaxID=6257 RepID=A0A915AK77_PARUN
VFLYAVYKQMRIKNRREHFSAIAKKYCEYSRTKITGRIDWRSHIHTVTCTYHCCDNSKKCRLQIEGYLIPLFTEERDEKTQKTCAGYLKHYSMKHFFEVTCHAVVIKWPSRYLCKQRSTDRLSSTCDE